MDNTNDQMSFLDELNTISDGTEEININDIKPDNKKDFIKSEFIEVNNATWEEMFSGFNEMLAITFSSGICFMSKLLANFEYSEIIFGNSNVVANDLSLLFANEWQITENILKNKSSKKLLEFVENDKLKLYVSRGIKSHEKIYLLKNTLENKYRVITGSANMSESAFTARQRENIIYYDSEEAYDYFYQNYLDYREECSDYFPFEKIKSLITTPEILQEDFLSNIPITNIVQTNKMIEVSVPTLEETEETKFITVIKAKADEIKHIIPKNIKKDINGKIILVADDVRKMQSLHKEYNKKVKIKTEKTAKLHINYDERKINFNNHEFNLNPGKEEIKNDIINYFKYMEGFNSFVLDNNRELNEFKEKWWKYTVWFFTSPFFPYIRYAANLRNYSSEILFPTYAILYGDSSGGKTSFSKFLSKMITGRNIETIDKESFTQTQICNLKYANEGVPLVIDDVTNKKWSSNSEEVLKNDNFGIFDENINYPSVVITTNSVVALNDYISKRAVIFFINHSIDKQQTLHTVHFISKTQKNISNNFWLEFARRMFDKINELINEMDKGIEVPDVFKIASKTLINIINEVEIPIPEYIRELNIQDDYFSPDIIGEQPRNQIIDAWKYNRKRCFKIDKKRNKLIFFYSLDNNQSFGNINNLKNLEKELPKVLNVKLSGTSLVMDLSEAEKYFGINFSKNIFYRVLAHS